MMMYGFSGFDFGEIYSSADARTTCVINLYYLSCSDVTADNDCGETSLILAMLSDSIRGFRETSNLCSSRGTKMSATRS